jgi:hypothetical protein
MGKNNCRWTSFPEMKQYHPINAGAITFKMSRGIATAMADPQ